MATKKTTSTATINEDVIGNGGKLHQTSDASHPPLTDPGIDGRRPEAK